LTHVDLTNTAVVDSLPSGVNSVLVANIVSPTTLPVPAGSFVEPETVTSHILFDGSEVDADSEGDATVTINYSGNTDGIEIVLDPPHGPPEVIFSDARDGNGSNGINGAFIASPTGDKFDFWQLRITNVGSHSGELVSWSLQLGTNPLVKSSNGIGVPVSSFVTSRILLKVLDDMIVGANGGNSISTINLDVTHPTPGDLTPSVAIPFLGNPEPGDWELSIGNSGNNNGIVNGWDIQTEYQSSP
jgi:subtilisin-like proprotein convertase family protein